MRTGFDLSHAKLSLVGVYRLVWKPFQYLDDQDVAGSLARAGAASVGAEETVSVCVRVAGGRSMWCSMGICKGVDSGDMKQKHDGSAKHRSYASCFAHSIAVFLYG